MSDDNILKSFLYQLGAKLDEPSIRKASDTLDKLSKTILTIGASVEGLALTLAAATIRMADSFEKMYYASQKTGASVQNTKAFTYAVSQLGGTAETAQASLDKFGDFLRRTPGAQEYLKNTFGIDKFDKDGKLKDTAKYLQEILETAGRLYNSGNQQKRAQAISLTEFLGVDEDTLRAVNNPEFRNFLARYNDEITKSGVNLDKAGQNSKAFMQQVRDLGVQLDILKIKVFADLEERFGPKLVQVADYLEQHLPAIATGIEHVIDKIIYLESAIERVVAAMGGWKQVSEELFALWAGGKVLGMLANVAKVAGALGLARGAGAVAGAVGTAAEAGVGGTALLAGGVALASVGGLAYLLQKYAGDRPGSADHPGFRWQSTGRSGRWVKDERAQEIQKYFISQGWTPEQAAGLVARIGRESGFDPKAEGDLGRGGYKAFGALQWRGSRLDDFKKWAGKDIRDSDLAEQIAFLNYELTKGNEQRAGNLLRQAKTATEAGRIASEDVARPKDRFGEAALTGTAAQQLFDATRLGVQDSSGPSNQTVNVTQTNTVNVHGADDPAATGEAVADSQRRANATLLRNTKGAIQ